MNEHGGIVREQSLLGVKVGDAHAEDRPVRRGVTERRRSDLRSGRSQTNSSPADLPRRVAAVQQPLARLWHRERESAHVVPAGHRVPVTVAALFIEERRC